LHKLLIRPDGGYDRRAIMAEAHRQFALMRVIGWNFGRCLSFAWKKAKGQRDNARLEAPFLVDSSRLQNSRKNAVNYGLNQIF
jgi:hypothetical protein